MNIGHDGLHNEVADAALLMLRHDGNVYDLEKAATVPDNATDTDRVFCVINDDTKQAVIQPNSRSFF